MTLSKLRPNSSFESIRKQAKKLARLVAANDSEAVARVHAQLSTPSLPLSLRDAQLVVAREYGFAGWKDLRTAVLRQEGKGLEWAAAEADRAIHDNSVERLNQLIQEYPKLLTWRGEEGESLLHFATDSFSDSGDPEREKTFTRRECAEFLLDAGAIVTPTIWEGAIFSRAKGVLQLLSRKEVLPRNLEILAALGDSEGVKELLDAKKSDDNVSQAFLTACRFDHRETAGLILTRCIELDKTLGERVDGWRGRKAFIDYLAEHPEVRGDPWETVVMSELFRSIDEDNLAEFNSWFKRQPELLDEAHLADQVRLIEGSVLNNRPAFILRLLELKPALVRGVKRPTTSAFEFAFEYGAAHLIPLLTQIWPLPKDLPHAAGVGDFEGVKSWFDEDGGLKLGNLNQHHPINSPHTLKNLRWNPPNAQHVLDVALAWSCLNKHFEIATFLLEHGADVNTDWNTHEPASILHDCALNGNYETAQFLIDHGIDLTIRDYRWNATAEGWAFYAAQDKEMAEFLANAQAAREAKT